MNNITKAQAEFAATLSKLVADQMILDADKVNKGEITVEDAAENIGKIQDYINENFGGIGGYIVRIAMQANEHRLSA